MQQLLVFSAGSWSFWGRRLSPEYPQWLPRVGAPSGIWAPMCVVSGRKPGPHWTVPSFPVLVLGMTQTWRLTRIYSGLREGFVFFFHVLTQSIVLCFCLYCSLCADCSISTEGGNSSPASLLCKIQMNVVCISAYSCLMSAAPLCFNTTH